MSTGAKKTLTGEGGFRVYLKSVHHEMVGHHPEEWQIEEVPFVLAFHGAQALYGASWHEPRAGLRVIVERAPLALVPRPLASR